MLRIIKCLKSTIVLCCIFSVFLKIGEVRAQNRNFVWGVNGHPLTQYDYRQATWDSQIKFLKDLRLSHYRIDIPLVKNGQARNENLFLDFMNRLVANNIVPMPVVFPREQYMVGDSISVYQSYFQQGKNFTERYGRYIDVMEVGNEWDLKLMISNSHNDGTKASHYKSQGTKERMWLLAGFIDGVKSVKASMKVSLSLTWTHWYYLDLLQQYDINYDIIGYHWYSNMGDITNVRAPYGNILQKIEAKYQKEIWITEFNTKNGTKNDSAKKQQYISKSLKNILGQGIVKGFFIYELFDQPKFKLKYPEEADYGLLYRLGDEYKGKSAFFSYKQIIEASN